MIDELGLKGLRRGRAVVSPRHANFVVNEGGASAADVLGLIDDVRERVRAANGSGPGAGGQGVGAAAMTRRGLPVGPPPSDLDLA